jgi:hypothetical protein
MRIARISLVYIGLTLLASMTLQAQQWRKIVPLHSTRADVERLLGPSEGKGLGVYKFENEVVTIQYSEDPCNKSNNRIWNVPPNTVINIIVSPRSDILFADLPIDKTKLRKEEDPRSSYISYINEEEGITYVVSVIGTVAYFNYGPKAQDSYLRCHVTSTKKSRRE